MLNEALRLIRVYHDLTQTQLCSEIGISNSHLSEIEKGKKQPSLDLLSRYSDRFNIPTSSLLFFSENLDSGKITDPVRLIAAKKVVSLLQWVEKKNEAKAPNPKLREDETH
jgi:transcriptional regulator with XRE-family HTH domain